MATTSEKVMGLSSSLVVLHPLVLLSIQDHAARAAKGTRKRVIGILLGQDLGPGRGYNVANSFAGQSRSSSLRSRCVPTAADRSVVSQTHASLRHSPLRRGRQGSPHVVSRSQLRRIDERHV